MPSNRMPSPARSHGAVTTPRQYKPRGPCSVGSPARSDVSGRLTSVINMNKNSFALSPLPNRRSVLADNTYIEEPKRKSWWRQLGENSRDVIEVIENNKVSTETNNRVEDLIEMEVLSQEKKSYNLDLPESSDGESIHSIVIPQRKIFKQKENEPQKKFGELVGNRETLPKLLKSTAAHDKSLNVPPRDLFQNNKQRNKPLFPAALLDISLNKTTADKTKENIKEPTNTQVRNIFGNRATTKRKNMFAEFVVSESEEEITEIQPRVFGFSKKSEQKSRGNTTSRGKREPSPASSVTTDMEMDDWNMLPSSTMVAEQIEEVNAATPVKRPKLSKLSEAIETDTQTNSTGNKTKQSNKSTSSKNKSKNLTTVQDKSLILNRSMTTRNSSKLLKNSSQNNLENEAINNSMTSQNISKNKSKPINASSNNQKLEEIEKIVGNTDKNNSLERCKKNVSKSNLLNIDGHKEKVQDHNVVNIFEDNKNSDGNDENVDSDENNFNLTYESDDQAEVNSQKEINTTIKNKNVTLKRASTAHQSNVHTTENISFKKLKVMDKKSVSSTETEESETFKESELGFTENNRTKTDFHNNSKSDHKQVKDVNNEIVEELMDVDKIDKGNSNVIDKVTEVDKAVQIDQQKQLKNLGDEKVRLETQDALRISTNINADLKISYSESHKKSHKQVVNEDDGLSQNEYDELIENENGPSEQLEEEIDSELEKRKEIEADDQNEYEPKNQNVSVEPQNETDKDDLNESQDEGQDESQEEQNESQEEQNVSQEDLQYQSHEPDQNESQVEEMQEIEDEQQNESGDEIQNDSEEEVDNESEGEVENESEGEVENESEGEVENKSEDEVENESGGEVENESEDEVQNESEEEVHNESEGESEDKVENVSEDEVQNDSEHEVQNGSEEEHDLNQEDDQNEDASNEENQRQNSIKETSEIREESEDFIEKTATPNSSGIKSPEAILRDKSNEDVSFKPQGRNTSVRKTKSMIKPLNIRPSLAPPRESTGFSEGGRDSSAEGSGWDSHRTTRKTLRQTFGRDFTPRKSLRAMVMEKSAKRQTAYMDARSEITTLPQANSTEYPDMSNHDYEEDESYQPSDHEVSRRMRQATLEMCLQEIKKKNLERRQRTEMEVKNLYKPSVKENHIFKKPARPMFASRRVTKPMQKKSKPKQINSVIPLDNLPPEMLDDMKYKPPKRFKPSNASWITKRLYKFLETKLEPKYDYKARVRAEKLVETLYHFTMELRRLDVAPPDAVQVLKHEMARLGIVKRHFDFYEFFNDFMPREIRVKVIPDIVNKIPMPKHGIFSEIQL